MINHNENEDGNEKIDHIGLDMNPNSKYKSVPALWCLHVLSKT